MAPGLALTLRFAFVLALALAPGLPLGLRRTLDMFVFEGGVDLMLLGEPLRLLLPTRGLVVGVVEVRGVFGCRIIGLVVNALSSLAPDDGLG